MALEEPEMIAILEGIAREGSDTARIQAIKALRAIRVPDVEKPTDDWTAIYGDEGNVRPIRGKAG